ncbi:MAG: chromosome segregation protein SMC [Desulfobacteraceae bacterium IS3]|nr:MAG: chromosome segregation protein SMC [Desulfobacteraceae bacterium IS3]
MIISRVILKNWRNFRFVDVPLTDRAFLLGPNACGKSNFLDVFRFLRDIAKPGGGLQSALARRGGLSKIRCLSARKSPDVEIEVHLSDAAVTWRYAIGIRQLSRGSRHTYLSYEKIWKDNTLLLERPDKDDSKDDKRLTQTHLEQIATNLQFRDISNFFESVLYLHLVPQLIRHPEAFSGPGMPEDPFGKNFMERVAKTSDKTRKARLKKIGEALRIAVPQMKDLTDIRDELGTPHLEAVYEHWRPNKAGKQREDQFSDGTLRLIALLWLLLESNSLLLLEEPELSLNSSIIRELPGLIYRLQSRKKAKHRQLILSTHSSDLLLDKGIGGEEVLLLSPGKEGTEIQIASSDEEIRTLLEGGLSVADAVLPLTAPERIRQLGLFS